MNSIMVICKQHFNTLTPLINDHCNNMKVARVDENTRGHASPSDVTNDLPVVFTDSGVTTCGDEGKKRGPARLAGSYLGSDSYDSI